MELLKSWLSAEYGRNARLAKHLKVPSSFITKMALGDKPVPVDHGAAIEQFTGGEVTRQQMFPNDWQRIWPELATTPAANDPQAPQPAEQGVGHV
jgi:DNA-binding transcriptional regulator YdaS (Cro superfamily)